MKVQIQFFSRLRELVGASLLQREVPAGATVGDLVRQMIGEFPALAEWDGCLLLAVGVEFASREQVLVENDLVSLMPPVQGG